MSKVPRLIFCLFLIGHICSVISAPINCLKNQTYSDKHTGRLECCSELCEDAKHKGTADQCQLKCPDYASAPEKQPEIPAVKDGATSPASGGSPVAAILISVVCLGAIATVVAGAVIIAVRSRRTRTRPQIPGDNVGESLMNNVTNATNNEASYPEQTAQPEAQPRPPVQTSQTNGDLPLSLQAVDN